MASLPMLSSLPDAPSRSDDSDTFVTKADAFVAALATLVAQFNAALTVIPEIAMAINYNTTSDSSVTIGTGSKTFTIPVDGLLQIGQFVIAASEAAPSNYMAGQVTSHNSDTGELIVDVETTGGSGAHSDWIIAVTVADALEPVASIAISGSGADLLDGSVTYAKIQSVTAGKLLGSIAGGAPIEIGLGSGLSFSAGKLAVSAGTATLADGDYGDLVVSTGGTHMVVDAKAITYDKMQDVSATDMLLGRSSAGAGEVEEIACTAFARSVLDDPDADTARDTLGCGSIATMDEATAAEIRGNVADKALSTDGVWAAADYVPLIQATTIAVDLSTGFNFTTTMTGNRTLGNPTNAKNGQCGVMEFLQDTTGGRTLAYAANWKFAGGTSPSLSTGANKRDLLFYQVISATLIYATLVKDVS